MPSSNSTVRALLVLLLTTSLAGAQSDPRLANLPAALQPFVDRGEISGIVALIATKDKILHLSAVGVSDLSTNRTMQTDDLFWIASMSKPMTAVCIGMLKDEGKLSFDDPLEKFLPEFKNTRPVVSPTSRPSRAVTVHDVLTHTSGLGELTQRQPHWTLAETSQAIAKMPLKFDPGTKWSYSTAGLDVLGRVVEVASGMPFDQFMQKRLFDPLGMTQTTFWLTSEQEKRYAKSYRLNPQTHKLEETTISYLYGTAVSDRQRPPLGGAGLFSTAADVARFYQMMLGNGTLLKPKTIKEMTSIQTGQLTARPGMPWGLGFCVIADPKALECNNTFTPGSFGHGGAFGTNSWVDPAKGMVYVLMLQRSGLQNPDNSPMRIAYQNAIAEDLKQ